MEEVGKLLPRIFKRQMRREDAQLIEILGPLWLRAAGKGIAENSRPIAFVAGTLTLETTCPTWASQLLQMAQELRGEINDFLGCPVVKKLEIKILPNHAGMNPRTSHDKLLFVEGRKVEINIDADGARKSRTLKEMKLKGSLHKERRLT